LGEIIAKLVPNDDEHFSLLHMNSRSAQKNLNDLSLYLETLSMKFSVIGLTETWFTEEMSRYIVLMVIKKLTALEGIVKEVECLYY